MQRYVRLLFLVNAIGLGLSACSTSAISTHGGPDASPQTRQDLGVDSHGNAVGAAWPAIPASDAAITLGNSAQRQLELGKESFRGDNFGHAERHFRTAVEINPRSSDAWAGLAASYDQLGRFDLADRAYDRLLKLRSNDARVMNNRGYSYLLRGDYVKAEQWLARAQRQDPSLEEIEGNMHLLSKVRHG